MADFACNLFGHEHRTFAQTTLPGCRPKAIRLVSGVGSEEVEFEPAIPLEGKVEIYMQVCLLTMLFIAVCIPHTP